MLAAQEAYGSFSFSLFYFIFDFLIFGFVFFLSVCSIFLCYKNRVSRKTLGKPIGFDLLSASLRNRCRYYLVLCLLILLSCSFM